MRFPAISTGWTKAGLLNPTLRLTRAKFLAPPLRPKAEEEAVKMVRRVRAVIFILVVFQQNDYLLCDKSNYPIGFVH